LNLDTDVYLFPVKKIESFYKDGKLRFELSTKSQEYIYILKNDMYEDDEYKSEEVLRQALCINDMEFSDYTKVYEDYDISIYHIEK